MAIVSRKIEHKVKVSGTGASAIVLAPKKNTRAKLNWNQSCMRRPAASADHYDDIEYIAAQIDGSTNIRLPQPYSLYSCCSHQQNVQTGNVEEAKIQNHVSNQDTIWQDVID